MKKLLFVLCLVVSPLLADDPIVIMTPPPGFDDPIVIMTPPPVKA